MKRLVVSGVILLSVIAICLWGGQFTKANCEKISSELLRSEQLMRENRVDDARECAKRAEALYVKKEKVFAAFVDHGVLDEAGLQLSAVAPFAEEGSREEFFSNVAQARVALEHLKNENRLILRNLF